jgi:hypothetical protein
MKILPLEMEARLAVERINDEARELAGFVGPLLTVIWGGEEIAVALDDGPALWDSEMDERAQVGTCPMCGGDGNVYDPELRDKVTCPMCGGDGKDDPREPLEKYLRKGLYDLGEALQLIGGGPVLMDAFEALDVKCGTFKPPKPAEREALELQGLLEHNHEPGETCWSSCPAYSGPRKAGDPR